jgi:hypothetical protein
MASQPEHHLGPSLLLLDGALNFKIGECILVRIPETVQANGRADDKAMTGTILPLTSNGSSTQHFAFIRQVTIKAPGSYLLDVLPVLSFTSSGGALAGYNGMDDTTKAMLLPLPPLSHCHPMPEAFGTRLNFGNWSTFTDSWLSIILRRFVMPTSRPVSLSFIIGSFSIVVESSLNE